MIGFIGFSEDERARFVADLRTAALHIERDELTEAAQALGKFGGGLYSVVVQRAGALGINFGDLLRVRLEGSLAEWVGSLFRTTRG